MTREAFWSELQQRVSAYDLLCHPFYKAWSAGQLGCGDLREYALEYYQHVAAFPGYLRDFAARLKAGQMRNAVVANMQDELGGHNGGRAHDELWLDFAEGMGAGRAEAGSRESLAEMQALVDYFRRTARDGARAEALAAFYAYESQVPRVAQAKAEGLRNLYQADPRACEYFNLHITADEYHSAVWRELLDDELAANPEMAEAALESAGNAARSLWSALDAVEEQRKKRKAA